MAIELPQPLGDRLLFDGAQIPPIGPIATYRIECREQDRAACGWTLHRIATEVEREQAGRRVVHLSLFGRDGEYAAWLDDGTEVRSRLR